LTAISIGQLKTVNAQLSALGHPQPDGFALIKTAEERLAGARTALERGEFARSYAESQRSLRTIRILERAHWEDAAVTCTHLPNIPTLSMPVSSPYATSFESLPDHWQFVQAIQANQFGQNLVFGDFESAERLSEDGWTQVMDAEDFVELNATLSAQDPHRGQRSLHLEAKPREGQVPPASLDPMLAALVSKKIPVKADDLIRIRFWLRVPATIQGSPEGAVVFDSIGGRNLAVTHTGPLEWKQFTLYRHVRRPDFLTLTIGLTGLGDLYVDDLVIERAAPQIPITRQREPQVVR
jgi:hypothetical protein